MSTKVNTFPNVSDGDVQIVLSKRPEDVLMLNTSVLAQESPFFKASLERLEWSHNKHVKVDAGKETEYSYKLLELELNGGSALPLLIGKVIFRYNVNKHYTRLTTPNSVLRPCPVI
jgi:hypothetical protein